MDKFSLDLNIICNDQSTLDAAIAATPSETDDRVWSVQYQGAKEYIDDDGNKVVTAKVRFHDKVDRDDIHDIITQVQGLLTLCEVDTWIRLLICRHNPDTENSPCEEEIVYRLVT